MNDLLTHLRKRPVLARFTLTCALAAGLPFAPVQAQISGQTEAAVTQADIGGSASERIALAGQLRMLNQRVVSAACYLHAGMEPDSSRATLVEAVDRFATIAAGLEFGDPALGIPGAEDRRITLAGLARLNAAWAPIAALATKIETGEGATEDIAAMVSHSGTLGDIADRLLVEITSQYASQTTVLQSDALRLEIAGRQQTLSQQIAKNGCLMSRGINPDASAAELSTAAAHFDTSMNALRLGLQDVGILPPPTPEIAQNLDEVARNWSFMAQVVSELSANQMSDDVTLGVMFLMSNQVTDNMAKVVTLYTEASKLDG